jgi:hypothetical protein
MRTPLPPPTPTIKPPLTIFSRTEPVAASALVERPEPAKAAAEIRMLRRVRFFMSSS